MKTKHIGDCIPFNLAVKADDRVWIVEDKAIEIAIFFVVEDKKQFPLSNRAAFRKQLCGNYLTPHRPHPRQGSRWRCLSLSPYLHQYHYLQVCVILQIHFTYFILSQNRSNTVIVYSLQFLLMTNLIVLNFDANKTCYGQHLESFRRLVSNYPPSSTRLGLGLAWKGMGAGFALYAATVLNLLGRAAAPIRGPE